MSVNNTEGTKGRLQSAVKRWSARDSAEGKQARSLQYSPVTRLIEGEVIAAEFGLRAVSTCFLIWIWIWIIFRIQFPFQHNPVHLYRMSYTACLICPLQFQEIC